MLLNLHKPQELAYLNNYHLFTYIKKYIKIKKLNIKNVKK